MKLFTQFTSYGNYNQSYIFKLHSGLSKKANYIKEQKIGYLQEYIFIADIKE